MGRARWRSRSQPLKKVDLIEKWKTAFCEDTLLRSVFDRMDMKIEFRPDLFVVNQESCGLADFSRWLTRQLLTVRLYHPAWSLIVVHATTTTLSILSAIVLIFYLLFVGNFFSATLMIAVLVAYQGINLWLLKKIDRTVVRYLPDVHIQKPIPVHKLFLAGVLAQSLYFWSVLNAFFLKSVKWRDIEYSIGGPWDIQMAGHKPYQHNNSQSSNSL